MDLCRIVDSLRQSLIKFAVANSPNRRHEFFAFEALSWQHAIVPGPFQSAMILESCPLVVVGFLGFTCSIVFPNAFASGRYRYAPSALARYAVFHEPLPSISSFIKALLRYSAPMDTNTSRGLVRSLWLSRTPFESRYQVLDTPGSNPVGQVNCWSLTFGVQRI